MESWEPQSHGTLRAYTGIGLFNTHSLPHMTVYLSRGQIPFFIGHTSRLFGAILAPPLDSVYVSQGQVQSCH